MTPGTSLLTPGPSNSKVADASGPGAKELFASPAASASENVSSQTSAFQSSNTPQQTASPLASETDPSQQPLAGIQTNQDGSTPTHLTPPPSGIARTKSAEEMFDEGPPVAREQSPVPKDPILAQPPTEQMAQLSLPERARTMSADELFAEPAPSENQPTSETTAPETASSQLQSPYERTSQNGAQEPAAGSGSAEEAFGFNQSLVQTTENIGAASAQSPFEVFGAEPPQNWIASSPDHPQFSTQTGHVAGTPSSVRTPADVFGAPPTNDAAVSKPLIQVSSEVGTATNDTAVPQIESPEEVFGAPPATMAVLQVPVQSTAEFFGAPPPQSTGFSRSPAQSPEEVFGAPPTTELDLSQPPVASGSSSPNVDGGNEEKMAEVPLTEVPLSPGFPHTQSATPTSNDQPPNAPADSGPSSGAESLFAAIGLPPPPMSSRR